MYEQWMKKIRVRRSAHSVRGWGLALSLTLLSGATVSGAFAGTVQNEVSNVLFENDGESLTIRIETSGSWAHWTLGNPPRIIVDVSDAVSHLPNSPGLFERELTSGPVRRFRTSQFSNTALDRRVRLTLELAEPTAYEATRVGQEIQIRIADDAPAGTLWALRGDEETEMRPIQESPISTPPAALASVQVPKENTQESETEARDESVQVQRDAAAEEFVDIKRLRQLLADSIAKNSPETEEPATERRPNKPTAPKPTVEKPLAERVKRPDPVAKPESTKKPHSPVPVSKPTSPSAPADRPTSEPDLADVKNDMQDRIASAMKGLAEQVASNEEPEVDVPEESPGADRLSTALASAFETVSDPAPVPRSSDPAAGADELGQKDDASEDLAAAGPDVSSPDEAVARSEEHTSELQSR